MADEDISRVQFSLQLFEQLDDLSLNRNIQCGGRLVQDDQRRVDADGARDGYTLALASRELVRISVDMVRFQPDRRQELAHPFFGFLLRMNHFVEKKRFGKGLAYGHSRVERRGGVLKHDLHLLAVVF